jgi:hypothetical protein
MAFLPQSYRDGQPEPWEYLEASAIGACPVGMALTLTSGKLAKCTGETRPDYISMYGGTVAAGDVIPCIRVHEETIFETEWGVANTGAAVGQMVTIDTTGSKATATTTNGVFEVVSYKGTAIGDTVRGRFIRPGTVTSTG